MPELDPPQGARRVRILLPTRGGTMAGLEFGPAEGPVRMVFSHANGFNARTYAALLAQAGVRVLALDARGHGLTRLPAETEGRRTWDDMTDDLLALLEAIGSGEVVLAGHSMGATVSLLAAAQAPARVASLILFEPVILPPGQPGELEDSPIVQGARRRRARFESREAAFEGFYGRGPFRAWPEAMLRDYLADGLKDAPDGGVQLAASPEWEVSNYLSQAHDVRGALRGLEAPAHILRAENGSTCRLTQAEIEAHGLEVETVAGTSHFLPMERPDLAAEALAEALRTVAPS